MLLSDNLTLFRLHLKFQSSFCTSRFSCKELKLKPTSKPNKKGVKKVYQLQENEGSSTLAKVKLFLFLIFVVTLWVQILHGRERYPMLVTLECVMYSAASSVFLLGKVVTLSRAPSIIELFNLFMRYEQRHLRDTSVKLSEKLMIWLAHLVALGCSITIVSIYGLMRWTDICKPSTFGYFLIPECHLESGEDLTIQNVWMGRTSISASSLVLLAFISVGVSFWLMMDHFSSYLLQVFDFCLVQSLCLCFFLKRLKLSLPRGWGRVGSRTGRKIDDCLHLYRELQILSRYFNKIQEDGIIKLFLFANLFTFIICVYVLIYVGAALPGTKLLFFICCTVPGTTGIICFVFFGKVHSGSSDLLEYIRETVLPNATRCIRSREIKRLSSIVRSLQPLKVKIGSVNFVDKMTAVVMLHFCFGQIINLLMMG